MESQRKRRQTLAARWALYLLVLLCAAALQTTPGFLARGEVKLYFILGVCLAVSMFEGEFYGALFGMAGGLLWDYTAGRIVGLFAIALMFLCWFASILVQLYLKPGRVNFFLLNLGCGLLLTGMDLLFFHIMPGYPAAWHTFARVLLPEALFSALAALVTIRIIRAIGEKYKVDTPL